MRILQQCIYFPPEVGGLESHAFYLCRELVRLGHEVTMVTSLSKPEAPAREVMDGVSVVRTWFPARNKAGWAAHTLASIPEYRRQAARADVLHAQTFASAPPAIITRRRTRQPLVLTLHTSHFLRLAKRPAWRPVLRAIIRSADWLLAASEEIRDVALDLHAHPHAEALTNGVDTTMFAPVEPSLPPGPHGFRLVVPRRLFEKNGVEFLIRAMPAILAEADVEVVIAGDGPQRSHLEALAERIGVSHAIRFLGSQPNTKMPGILSSADVVVVPSLMEATSIAALEAMSCQRPVAASNTGGLPEIVDDTTGTLFEPADPESLARAVVALLRRDDLVAMGVRARERVVRNWSIERLAKRHVEIYTGLLNGKNSG